MSWMKWMALGVVVAAAWPLIKRMQSSGETEQTVDFRPVRGQHRPRPVY
jgi:hypothetical protein